MSLFGGLFGHAGASGGLFSTQSVFKAHHDDDQPEQHQKRNDTDSKNNQRQKQHTNSRSGGDWADAATDAAARKLQAGIAAAKAAQHAAEASEVDINKQKRRTDEKQEKQSKKAQKRAAGSSPAAASAKQTDKQQLNGQQSGSHHTASTPSKLVKDKKRQKSKQSQLEAAEQATTDTAQLDKAEQQERNVTTAAAPDANDLVDSIDSEVQTHGIAQDAETAKLSPEEQAEKLARTVFVGNLPVAMKHKQLTRLFSGYGEVESVRMRSVPVDLESKAKLPRKAAVIKGSISSDRGGKNAYVVFKQQSSVEAALAANMTEVDGHHLRVDRAAKPSAAGADGATTAGGGGAGVLYDPVRSVFVGNLDFKVTEEQLIQTFSDGTTQPELTAAVEAVRVVRDPRTNIGKGIAYVLFKTKAAARAALQLDGQQLGKRAMRVSRVDRNKSTSKSSAAAGLAAGQKSSPGGGAKRFQDKSRAGGGKAPAGQHRTTKFLGVKQGGVQKRNGKGAAAAADWQGLRTKGKGSGFRGNSRASKPSDGSAAAGFKQGRGSSSKSKGQVKGGASNRSGGKRPAVAARKEKAKAAAKKAKAGSKAT